ncbi:MAG: class I SAM-dependent rRNA methyltransferase [Gemmatimonadales bacterium]
MKLPTLVVSPKGVGRLRTGHPWVFRSDLSEDGGEPGLAHLVDGRGKGLGTALYSPASEIRARWLAPDGAAVDRVWWTAMVRAALDRRRGVEDTAYRVVHAEGDGLPALIVDRYGDYAVAQLLSAGLEAVRDDVIAAIRDTLAPEGLLLRNDPAVRERERLPREVTLAFGEVPEMIEVREGRVRFLAAPWTGQKTGAFLDQRENRQLIGARAGARCLDAFAYHGLFALHLAAGGAKEVVAVEISGDALGILEQNTALNGVTQIRTVEANAFDWLKETAATGERFDTVVLDPPAFARDRRSLGRALAGYKEINLRAMHLLAPGGVLFTASCSHHVHRGDFFGMLADAASDSGRRLQLLEIRGAAADHPEIVTVPETGYLKAALLRATD